MSTEFVILDVNINQCLQALQLDDDIIVTDHDDHYVVETPIDKQYSLQKRMAMSRITGIPGDDIQQGGNKASIFMNKVEDDQNTWFTGYGTSVHHPEVVLDRIIELLKWQGVQASYMSEHDDGYHEMLEEMGFSVEDDEEVPGGYEPDEEEIPGGDYEPEDEEIPGGGYEPEGEETGWQTPGGDYEEDEETGWKTPGGDYDSEGDE